MGVFALVMAGFLVVLFMVKHFLKEPSHLRRASAPASLPSGAAPQRSIWVSFLPHKSTTLYFSLPLDQARQMLINRSRSPWVSGESGLFGNQRRYDVAIHGDTIVIEGPFGHKKTTLHTEGTLLTTPYGTALQLASGISRDIAIMVGLALLFMLVVGSSIFFGSFGSPILIVVPMLIIYGVQLVNVRYESNLIADLCGCTILGVSWRR